MIMVRGLTRHIRPPTPHFSPTDPIDWGLVGEWRFACPMGRTLVDSSQRANHGTLGGCTWRFAEYGPALSFNGTGDYVNCGSAPSLDDLREFSYEAFFRPTNISSTTYGGLLVKDDLWDLGFFYDSDGRIRVYIPYDAQAGYANSAYSIIVSGVWHHAVTTYSEFIDRTPRLYLNGRETSYDAQVSSSGNLTSNASASLYIGENQSDRYFYGDISVVRVYNRVLTDAEVARRYQICLRRRHETSIWPLPWAKAPTLAAILGERGALRGVVRGGARGV